MTRVVNKAVEVKASHRVGFNLTWESATLKGATIETWYNDWNKGSQFKLEGNTLYVDNISVEGNIAADHVKALGVRINGEFHSASAQSNTLAISPISINGLSSGVYTVQPVAQVELNGELKWLEGGEVTKTVTSIPTVIDYSVRTSYSSNGSVAKTNDINGDVLKVKANLSDSYVANNLVNGKTYTICYGSNTATQTLGAEKTLTLAHTAWGQYVCYVKISLANGYVIESQKYTTSITGIPYSIQFYNSNIDNIKGAGWTLNGSYEMNSSFLCLYRTSSKSKKVNGYAVSPKLPITENTNVDFTIKHKSYWVGFSSKAVKGYIGATSSATQAASSYVTCEPESTGELGTSALRTQSGSISLTPNNCYISISHDEPTATGAEFRYLVYSLEVNYK